MPGCPCRRVIRIRALSQILLCCFAGVGRVGRGRLGLIIGLSQQRALLLRCVWECLNHRRLFIWPTWDIRRLSPCTGANKLTESKHIGLGGDGFGRRHSHLLHSRLRVPLLLGSVPADWRREWAGMGHPCGGTCTLQLRSAVVHVQETKKMASLAYLESRQMWTFLQRSHRPPTLAHGR